MFPVIFLKKELMFRTGHKRVQLVGTSDNVCRGKLQIEDTKTRTWSPVASVDTISPDLACNHMYCGTSAHSSLERDGMQLNCTGKVTQPSCSAESFMKVALFFWLSCSPAARQCRHFFFFFFADNVAVAVSGVCVGSVSISVNNTTHHVCGSHWTRENAQVVCDELKCGKVSHRTT